MSVCIQGVRLLDSTELHVYKQYSQYITEFLRSSKEGGDVGGGLYVIGLLGCFKVSSDNL